MPGVEKVNLDHAAGTERTCLTVRKRAASARQLPPTGAPPVPCQSMIEGDKDMDRWLGDGGMAVIGAIGGSFDDYGSDGEGWAAATWVPSPLACNPHGVVQAGVHAVMLDAAMNFAINAGLRGADRTKATLEMKTETMRVARSGDELSVRGSVVRQARQVAFGEATVRNGEGELVSRATGTFLLHREDP